MVFSSVLDGHLERRRMTLVCITDSIKQLLAFLLITTLRQEADKLDDVFGIIYILYSPIMQSFRVFLFVWFGGSMYSPELKKRQHKDVRLGAPVFLLEDLF